MTYLPDPRLFQQLVVGGKTAAVDCTAHGGAWCTAAHTQGKVLLNGRQIRLASDEPIPDPKSPGLNVGQVDAAIYRLTSGRVNLDTPEPRHMTRAIFQSRVVDGRWANLAVRRGVLVDRGAGGTNGFRGAHDITIHADLTTGGPVIGDPLVPYYIHTTWDAAMDAAQTVNSTGYIYCSFTRDLSPDYRASLHPRAGFTKLEFVHYLLDGNGKIAHRRTAVTGGFSATCTPPKWHTGSNGITGRRLVQLTSGSRKGYWVSANWAKEIIP